jgi:Fe-S-cluster containining protein
MAGTRRFACTKCGMCCDRAPEVELAEAAGLVDVFVFRLMFRVYSLPCHFDAERSKTPQDFYARKRLLKAHAAHVSRKKLMRDGRIIDHLDYLMISALSVDTVSGSCAALTSTSCSIYGRRPLACRTVPFHYARAESSAEHDLEAFVTTPGYRCDVGPSAPVVIESGILVDPSTTAARSEAMAVVEHDGPWKRAILRAMKTSTDGSLPRREEVEVNARFGAMTTSMRVAWRIAVEAGLMREADCTKLVATQLGTIERELESGRATGDERRTLHEMEAEYRAAL